MGACVSEPVVHHLPGSSGAGLTLESPTNGKSPATHDLPDILESPANAQLQKEREKADKDPHDSPDKPLARRGSISRQDKEKERELTASGKKRRHSIHESSKGKDKEKDKKENEKDKDKDAEKDKDKSDVELSKHGNLSSLRHRRKKSDLQLVPMKGDEEKEKEREKPKEKDNTIVEHISGRESDQHREESKSSNALESPYSAPADSSPNLTGSMKGHKPSSRVVGPNGKPVRGRSQSISIAPNSADAANIAAATSSLKLNRSASQRALLRSDSGIHSMSSIGRRRYSIDLSASEVAALSAKPSIMTKPEFFESHMDTVFEHYAHGEQFLNKRRVTRLAMDSLDQFRSDYEEMLRKNHPNMDDEHIAENLKKDLKHMLPGKSEKEIILNVVNHLMATMDPDGTGQINKQRFIMHWKAAHKQLFDLGSATGQPGENPLQCSIM